MYCKFSLYVTVFGNIRVHVIYVRVKRGLSCMIALCASTKQHHALHGSAINSRSVRNASLCAIAASIVFLIKVQPK